VKKAEEPVIEKSRKPRIGREGAQQELVLERYFGGRASKKSREDRVRTVVKEIPSEKGPRERKSDVAVRIQMSRIMSKLQVGYKPETARRRKSSRSIPRSSIFRGCHVEFASEMSSLGNENTFGQRRSSSSERIADWGDSEFN